MYNYILAFIEACTDIMADCVCHEVGRFAEEIYGDIAYNYTLVSIEACTDIISQILFGTGSAASREKYVEVLCTIIYWQLLRLALILYGRFYLALGRPLCGRDIRRYCVQLYIYVYM